MRGELATTSAIRIESAGYEGIQRVTHSLKALFQLRLLPPPAVVLAAATRSRFENGARRRGLPRLPVTETGTARGRRRMRWMRPVVNRRHAVKRLVC